ncbi:mCG1027732 [Mus musculus]|nr:mCG1027732 [Mus musculus]
MRKKKLISRKEKRIIWGAEEITYWLRACVAFLENSGLISSTYMVAHKHL